jgi:CBS domain-containing protein
MSKAKISAISVQADGRLVGVLTDSDITEKIVAPGLDAASVTVGELMDPDPVRISDDRDIESAALVMQARGARSLVVQDLLGRFVGLLTDCELCQVVHGRSPEAIQ